MTSLKSPWLIAFGLVSMVHLVLNGAGVGPWDSITKCFIAPLLTAWVVEQRGPRPLVLALAFCFFGDLLLEIESLFIAGMAAFAAAHVTLIAFFVRRGALERLRHKPWIAIVYVATAIALVAWCWGGLEADLKVPVPIYTVLLISTAATALATDPRAGAGGAMFLVSDGIIALAQAGRIDSDAAATGLAIMTLYILAIFFLSTGILRREQRTVAAGPGFDPTVRTDCWPRVPSSKGPA